MENEYMRIGEIAGFFNISVKALHVYEKKGIIKPAKVDEKTGYRYYSADQVKQLNALIDLQSLGFTLDEIKEILCGNISRQELLEKLDRKKWAWQETINAAQHKMELLESIEERFQSPEGNKKLETLTEDERAWLLVRMVCVEDVKAQSLLSEAIWL